MNVALLVLVGCRSENDIPPVVDPPEDPVPLALVVDAPVAGTFVGDRAAVRGTVSDPRAVVWIEGYRANVGPDGAFSVEVPVGGDFRVIDVEATRPGEHLRERRPVFSGVDPLAGWTGGIGARLTPVALDHVAEIVRAEADGLDLPALIDGILPSLDLGGLAFAPTGTTVRPAEVTLVPGPDGLVLTVVLKELEVGIDVTTDAFGTTPVVLGLDAITLVTAVDVVLDDDGALVVSVRDATVSFGEPILVVGVIEATIVESWAAGLASGVADLLSGVLDLGTTLIGDLVVPFAGVETDVLGFPLSASLDAVGTDEAGIGLRLGVDLGIPAAVPFAVPSPIQAGPKADLALSLHEGLMQGLLASDVLDVLDLDLSLPGVAGEVLALPIAALPGGDQLPAERTAMCLALDPGAPRVARLKPDTAPFAVLTFPDVRLTVGVGADCAPWLEASLAVQASFEAEGATLAARIAVVDGAVLAYAAEGTFDEDEIVGGLGALVDAATTLLGPNLTLDLSSLFGEIEGLPLGTPAPRIVDANAGSAPGEVVLGISLWD